MLHEKDNINSFYHSVLLAIRYNFTGKKNKCDKEELENDISSDLYQKIKQHKREFSPQLDNIQFWKTMFWCEWNSNGKETDS